MIERRLGTHLVKADAERLGGVEGANGVDRQARQRPLGLRLDRLLIPSHEHMFAYAMDAS